MRAVKTDHPIRREPVLSSLEEGGRRERVKRFLQFFMQYGLVAAVLVWAAVVGLMAYHLDESPWRWVFVALVAGGLATVGVIFRIRKYIDSLDKTPQQEHQS